MKIHVVIEKFNIDKGGLFMKQNTYERKVQTMNYATIELSGGHLDRHVGNEDGELIARITERKIDCATTFDCEVDDVISLMQQALLDADNEADVLEWINDYSDGDDWEVYFEFSAPIGHGFYRKNWHEWNNGAVYCSAISVILRKNDNTDSFDVVTAYPVATEEDIADHCSTYDVFKKA